MKGMKRFIKISLIGLIFIIVAIIGVYTYAKLSPKIEINGANSLAIYDDQGELFFQGSGSKKWIELKNISPNLINATIAAEDKNFYKHKGFDLLRILKATYINITSKAVEQGASTITQQYAKNLFLDFDKTWKRKLEEMWYTIEIETHYDKDTILEGYLNTINYGHGMYGIENASKFYFNKSAKNLTLAEAAMLTGIPKSPSNYSPLVDFETAKNRQLLILDLMVKNKMISKEEKEQAYKEELHLVGENNSTRLNTLMYYQDAVLKELESIKAIPNSYSKTKGLKIYTNLNMEAQTNLEKSIQEEFPEESKLQISTVMMNPNNGKIVALVGGRDYTTSQFNRATDAMRQVGSTMKPYLYYAALENGFTSSSCFTSEKTTFTFANNSTYSPNNYNNLYGEKPISMATAIAYSENIYAVKTHMFLGSDALIDVAKRVGITAKLDDVASLPLGTKEINIIEMAAGYSAFANQGSRIKPHFIERVEDHDGKVLYQAKTEKTKVLDESLTFILSNMLTGTYDADYVDYNYPTAISLAPKLTHKYALKSGTTETDNWYIGYNKDIVTAVWVGYDDNQSLSTKEYKYAQNIWYKNMESYESGKKDSWYEVPENVSSVLVEPISGKPATENSGKKKLMYFIKGTEPTLTDSVFDEKLTNSKRS